MLWLISISEIDLIQVKEKDQEKKRETRRIVFEEDNHMNIWMSDLVDLSL